MFFGSFPEAVFMELFIQTLTNALVLAAIYILVSLGFAFLFNMLGVFNVAHGSLYMAAGYLGYLFIGALGINQWLSLIIVVVIFAAFGLFLERACFRPFLGDFNRQIMIGVSLIAILETSVNILIGSQMYIIPTFVEGTLKAGAYSVSWDRLFAFGLGAVLLVLIILFVNKSRWGLQMQAITQNMEGAALQGINIHRISGIVSSLGCALAAIAGILMGSLYTLDPFMGNGTLIKILILIILAGVGSFKGIIYMGLLLGALYATLPLLIQGAASDAVAVVIILAILLLRPQGFFGREVA
jgi:branched-chain amino acid transport system permease protein